ncbi:replication initiation protein RepM [Psychrobacter sp. GP33]|uniref:replication initiation protein RepM n=1 Tax=Psychrobacter sp. GP33 TaxID=2758709 RepID=UPI0021753573|nr:replication initiation protein RepM [Psychrobacter sp. GP33]
MGEDMNIDNKKMGLVVKTNRLNTAIQNLTLAEIRLVQLAIIDSREKNEGLSADKPLIIKASRYAEAFGTTRQGAYDVLKKAEENLFERRFTFLDENDGYPVKSRWISQAKYKQDKGTIEIIFTPAVVNEITRINGIEQFFTKYTLEQTSTLNSMYSVRLYELLIQWREAKKTPLFGLKVFRGQLGVDDDEYERMCDFKSGVLHKAITEINKHTDIKVSYDQEKDGKNIVGFKFKVLTKDKPKATKQKGVGRDADTADMFAIEGLNDNQLGRIARNPSFVADYNHMVSSTSPAGQDPKAWEFEMINRLKKDASQFKKRPLREYLEY